MNPRYSIPAALGLLALALLFQSVGQEPAASSKQEYVTIRWDGKHNPPLSRPGAMVEFMGPELRKLPRPERADERSFYMNTAMNGLAREGFELAGMTSDEIVMKRAAR